MHVFINIQCLRRHLGQFHHVSVGARGLEEYTFGKSDTVQFSPQTGSFFQVQIEQYQLALKIQVPCQSFSIAGRREGFQDITRGTLFFEICRILRDKKPRYVLLENVKGLLSHDGGRTFAVILLSLDELGYDAEWQVLNTKYWLPQNRERVFNLGVRR